MSERDNELVKSWTEFGESGKQVRWIVSYAVTDGRENQQGGADCVHIEHYVMDVAWTGEEEVPKFRFTRIDKKDLIGPVTPVIVESPFAGDVETNIKFAQACVRDSLSRGEAPLASHLLYTQEGILNDDMPDERNLGIEAGLAWGIKASKTIVYTNLGITRGMERGIQRAEDEKREVEYRELDSWDG